MQRTIEQANKLEDYLIANWGKKYKIPPNKILRFENCNKECMFCSEMIVEVYKLFGLIG